VDDLHGVVSGCTSRLYYAHLTFSARSVVGLEGRISFRATISSWNPEKESVMAVERISNSSMAFFDLLNSWTYCIKLLTFASTARKAVRIRFAFGEEKQRAYHRVDVGRRLKRP
jgi:hypothetical protein